jgi:hypothetical protein
MSFNRNKTLAQWALARSQASNPQVPEQARNLYQQAAQHAQVALGLQSALERNQQQAALGQPPQLALSQQESAPLAVFE